MNILYFFFSFIFQATFVVQGEGGVFLLVFQLDLESCPLKPKTFLKIYEWKKQTVCVFRAAEKWRGNIFVSISPSTAVTSWNSGETQLKKWWLKKGDARAPPEGAGRLFFDSFRRETCICSQNVDFFVCLRPPSPPYPLFSLLFTRSLRTRYFYSLSSTSMTSIHIIGSNLVEIPSANFWIFHIVWSWENSVY